MVEGKAQEEDNGQQQYRDAGVQQPALSDRSFNVIVFDGDGG